MLSPGMMTSIAAEIFIYEWALYTLGDFEPEELPNIRVS